MTDYYVSLVALPLRVEGVTVPNSDGSFSVYINSALPEERRTQVLEHELRHIAAEHFYVDMPVECMERQAGGEALNLALHPPQGKLVHFTSEDALAGYVRRLAMQSGASPAYLLP